MARFISTDSGEVNLDFVARVTYSRGETLRRYSATFYGPQGERLGTDRYASFNELECLTRPIVPAAPDARAVRIWLCSDDETRPTESNVFSEALAVRAWQIAGDSAWPIFADQPGARDRVLIEEPGGRLVAPLDASYESIDAAKADILREAQEEFDARQNRAATNGGAE